MVFKCNQGIAVKKNEYGNDYLDEIKKPKAFHLPTIQMMLLYPPTNRYVLWIISNAPYSFNVYFFGRYVQKNPKLIDEGTILKRALDILSVLRVQKMIKKDENDNWKITAKGQLHRLTSHPNFGIFAPSIAILLGVTLFILNRELSTKQPAMEALPKSKLKSYDSVSKHSPPF